MVNVIKEISANKCSLITVVQAKLAKSERPYKIAQGKRRIIAIIVVLMSMFDHSQQLQVLLFRPILHAHV